MTRSLPLAGTLALPLLAAASVAIAAGTGAVPGRARVELEIAGVLPLEEDWAMVLVLREKGAATLLPVVVPGQEGKDLRAALGRDGHRPAARVPESLLDRTIAALGARIVEVELDAAEETARAARVHLVQGRKEVQLAARPSESIPLAVAAGAPIVTSRRVLDESGLTRTELERLSEKSAQDAPLRL